MTKAEVISEISDKTGIPKEDVSVSIEAFFSIVKNSMADGHNIYVRGFGSFVNKKRLKPFTCRAALVFRLAPGDTASTVTRP